MASAAEEESGGFAWTCCAAAVVVVDDDDDGGDCSDEALGEGGCDGDVSARSFCEVSVDNVRRACRQNGAKYVA